MPERHAGPPANWDRGFHHPLRIAGGGHEVPFLHNGVWYLRVWDCKERKHYLYNYSTDIFEDDR